MNKNSNLEKAYNGKNVIVLGGAGFVGHALVRCLMLHGARVNVIDNFSRGRVRIRGVPYIMVDIEQMDSESVYGALPNNVDYIFNLAAFVAGVEFNKGNQSLMYDRNILLGTAPLEWAALTGAKYMYTSSVCVYPEDRQIMSVEDDVNKGIPNAANMGYSLSKLDGERATMDSAVKHAVVVRPSNIIGPRDYFDDRAHVLPHLIKRAFSIRDSGGGSLEVWGNNQISREFVHSHDAASGMMFALAFGEDRQAYNIGTNGDTEATIALLALTVMSLVPVDAELVYNGAMGGGDLRRTSNANKLRHLGWRHEKSVFDGIQDAVDTYVHIE